MNIGTHEFVNGAEHEPMAFQGRQAGELGADNTNAEMTFAVAGTGMPGVQVTFIDYLQGLWRECRGQGPVQALAAVRGPVHAGSIPVDPQPATGLIWVRRAAENAAMV